MPPSLSRFRARRAGVLALFCAGVLLQVASAATVTWNGTTNGLWGTAGNWDTGSAPTTADAVIILGPSNVAGALTINVSTSANASTINFTDTSAVSLTNTSSGANQILAINGAGGITTGTGAVTIGSTTANQGINIALGANQTWTVGAGGMTVNNVISGAFNLTKAGTGTLTLSGANTYTGQTWINGDGILSINTLGNYTEASSLGAGTAGTQILLGQTSTDGTLVYTGSGNTSNRSFQISTSTQSGRIATITNNGTGALVFTAANFTVRQESATTATRTLALSGNNTGNNEIQGVIQSMNSTVGSLGVTKSGTGTWILKGNNTYTGATTISAGTLTIGGAGQLGSGSYS